MREFMPSPRLSSQTDPTPLAAMIVGMRSVVSVIAKGRGTHFVAS